MADTTTTETTKQPGQRKTLIGKVTSTKMAKTIVVEVRRQKAHPFYKRVVARTKKFYAHDENGTARLGDFVQIEETRPLSKLKRWTLKEVVQRAALVQGEAVAAVVTEEQSA
jgi:small subunit ribosomal protein S17